MATRLARGGEARGGAAIAALAVAACACSPPAPPRCWRERGCSRRSAGRTAHVDAASSWTVYHGNPLGTGVDPSGVTFSPANPAWRSPVLDGQVYGEPLEATGRVYVATENDTIYALAANTGAVLWSTNVGTPVPSAPYRTSRAATSSPCSGITGTPVIDTARGEIFAVADELVNGAPAHFLVGLNMYTGASVLTPVPVDPPDGRTTRPPTSCSAPG